MCCGPLSAQALPLTLGDGEEWPTMMTVCDRPIWPKTLQCEQRQAQEQRAADLCYLRLLLLRHQLLR